MCGYLRREISLSFYQDILDQLQLDLRPQHFNESLLHVYPAFAGTFTRTIPDSIVSVNGTPSFIDPIWWFDVSERNGDLIQGHRESFNARNLKRDLWVKAIDKTRGFTIATGLGESKHPQGKSKSSFLMIADQPLLVALLYKQVTQTVTSAAVITRDTMNGFDTFHDKAFPLLLPMDKDFIHLWLSDEPSTHPDIAHFLSFPKLHTPLTVTEVKSFKSAEPRTKKTVSVKLFPDEVTPIPSLPNH